DDFDDLHPLTLKQYHGIHGHVHTCLTGQTGAGHPPNKDLEDKLHDNGASEMHIHGHDILRRVKADLQDQVYHEAIPVPSCNSLFACTDNKAEFCSVFENVMLKNITPAGYGLLPHELE
ncbi:hypothetical protein J3A83DRAFT_4039755, partial [Scleroderma citrinum]